MNLTLLQDFLELARVLNFSRAAENRNMTQPAFSRRIQSLEDELQVALISRTTRQVDVTPAGKAFQLRAETIVRLVAQARQEALAAAGCTGHSLNLASTHALSYTFVPRWLMQLAGPAEFGTLNLMSDTYRQCTRLIQAGEVSFFICHKGSGAATDLSDRQYRRHSIGNDRLVPLCAPDPAGHPIWPLDGPATAVPHIAYGTASGLYTILETHWQFHGRPRIVQAMKSVLAATNLEMAKAGQGVAYIPLSLAENDLARGRLVRAGDASHDVPVEVVIYRPRSRLSAHCEAFWRKLQAAEPALFMPDEHK